MVRERLTADLKAPFLALAADMQTGVDPGSTPEPASTFFDDEVARALLSDIVEPGLLGRTHPFDNRQGAMITFISLKRDLLLGRIITKKPNTNLRHREQAFEVVAHELTHSRNSFQFSLDITRADSDASAYDDPALAAARSAVGPRTSVELLRFVGEVTATHVSWIVTRERADDPGAPKTLTPAELAAAAQVYITTFGGLVRANGYIDEIVRRGQPAQFRQLALWLDIVAGHSFSDDFDENIRTRQLFRDTAAFCRVQAASPFTPLPKADGLLPLPKDFV